jgi:hypothetical protein
VKGGFVRRLGVVDKATLAAIVVLQRFGGLGVGLTLKSRCGWGGISRTGGLSAWRRFYVEMRLADIGLHILGTGT